MTPAEVAKLLTIASAVDNRIVTTAGVKVWNTTLAGVEFEDGAEAVTRHFATSKEYLLPAHVREGARRIREEREREARKHRPPLPPPEVTLDREGMETETAKWITFYREHLELRVEHAERSRTYPFPFP